VKVSKLTITRYALATDGIAVSINSGTGIEFNRVLIYANVGSAGQGAVCVNGTTTSVTFKILVVLVIGLQLQTMEGVIK